MILKAGLGVLAAVVCVGVLAGCSTPRHVFSVENTCPELVAVSVGRANEGGHGFTELGVGEAVRVQVAPDISEMVFLVNSDLVSGSPDLSYVEFNVSDLKADGDGIYHLVVGDECEAVQPAS